MITLVFDDRAQFNFIKEAYPKLGELLGIGADLEDGRVVCSHIITAANRQELSLTQLAIILTQNGAEIRFGDHNGEIYIPEGMQVASVEPIVMMGDFAMPKELAELAPVETTKDVVAQSSFWGDLFNKLTFGLYKPSEKPAWKRVLSAMTFGYYKGGMDV